jgi:hypothetical protein
MPTMAMSNCRRGCILRQFRDIQATSGTGRATPARPKNATTQPAHKSRPLSAKAAPVADSYASVSGRGSPAQIRVARSNRDSFSDGLGPGACHRILPPLPNAAQGDNNG